MYLKDALPKLTDQLEIALSEIGEVDLSATVKELQIVGRCKCDDSSCGTFYTLDKKLWSGKKLRQVVPVVQGLYAIDIHNDTIACVEIMGREEISKKLNEICGANT